MSPAKIDKQKKIKVMHMECAYMKDVGNLFLFSVYFQMFVHANSHDHNDI